MKKIVSLLLVILTLFISLSSCSNAEKSCEKLDEYITSNAEQIDGVCTLTLGESVSDGVKYVRSTKRTATEIELILTVSEGSQLRSFTLVLNKSSLDSYKWYYSSSVSGRTMSGTLIPKDYTEASSTLGYMSTNSSDEYEIASMASYAKGMCNYLLRAIEGDLAKIEITAYDLGFKSYKK